MKKHKREWDGKMVECQICGARYGNPGGITCEFCGEPALKPYTGICGTNIKNVDSTRRAEEGK